MKIKKVLETVSVSPQSSYSRLVKPLVSEMLSLLKMDVAYHRAEGENLYFMKDSEETEVKDFLAGYGSCLLGHHFPPLVKHYNQALVNQVPFQSQASIKILGGELAEKLNSVLRDERAKLNLPTDLDYICSLTSTGAESVEVAVKVCLMNWQARRDQFIQQRLRKLSLHTKSSEQLIAARKEMESVEPIFLALKDGFHGKTMGAVHLTANSQFSEMYQKKALNVIFVDPSQEIPTDLPWHQIAGFFYEPIRAEGGVHHLPSEFLEKMKVYSEQHGFPLVADEIQTGCMRCGRWSYSHQLGVVPDILLLGKALGGGMVKIGAVLTRKENYPVQMDIKNTSTFAEDELSSSVSLAAVEWMKENEFFIEKKLRAFEFKFHQEAINMKESYPGIIKRISGAGLLFGIEFDTDSEKLSFLAKSIFQSGFGSYFLASYLLNQHGIRVGVSLSAGQTLRIEPSIFYSEESFGKLISGLKSLCHDLSIGKLARLTSHLWNSSQLDENLVSPQFQRVQPSEESISQTAFLSHLIAPWQARKVDPLFETLSAGDLDKVIQFSELLDLRGIIEESLFKDIRGETAHFRLYGLLNTSEYFEKWIRAKNVTLLERIQKSIYTLEQQGVRYFGLGQYTSIVAMNGLALSTRYPQTVITTGNSLTVAMTLEAVKKVLKEKNLDIRKLTVGIVGATGNICQVLAQFMGDDAQEMWAFYKEESSVSEKFQLAIKNILDNSKIRSDRLKTSSDFSNLLKCDLVLVGTNSAKPIIFSHHLKPNAVVLDVSVPANVDASVIKSRPDVSCFSGGLVKLPLGQTVMPKVNPLPAGETYACLAETMMMGLLTVEKSYSLGNLTKADVLRAWEDSKKVGYELGSLHYFGTRILG